MRSSIAPEKFNTDSFRIFDKGWFLLTGGDFYRKSFNAMTVSWGGFGTMWGKPVVTVVVRPQRHTLKFLDAGEDFTLCAFGEEFKEALTFLGRNSGRDVPDKIAKAGLTPMRSDEVSAPAYTEAELVIECRKLYRGELKGKDFCEKSLIRECYPDGDFHYFFVAEVKAITGSDKYKKQF